ncbi:hypothetical protein [Hyalangium rubrum]|uniref:PPE family protein n=1 Tax=Hyalangium rubrum TaxID=3103134 RepID=A0ABU5H5C0_9BACT|nr:hypothetical protein [Hyalangium sp. s54d21]MDY7228059.1 hypothetical protein [Hyalangium sp. s54d21]
MGCGALEEGSFAAESEPETRREALASTAGLSANGLSVNGLSVNGLSVNGLSVNGLSVNGLSVNGLLSATFKSWFEADPVASDTLMKYAVLCAVPANQVRTFTSTLTGLKYTWQGLLGLAPGWSTGLPATQAEQQVITACLAAHANKFGIHISISVLGLSALGLPIPFTSSELETYSEDEACFFGNAFTDEGIFAATNRSLLHASESTARACGLSSRHASTDCPPIVHVGSCKSYCTLDSTRTYYTQCTYNGVSYRPITTRILPTDIYSCGDGVCQFTESCGNGGTYDNCFVDCGACR